MSRLLDISRRIIELEKSMIHDDIEKAWTSKQIGEVVTRSDGKKYRKISSTGDSKKDWQLVTQEKGSKAEEEKKKPSKKELSTHAKNTSESSLQTAIKESSDPSIRAAAHQELKRRETEEKPQEDKKEKAQGKESKESGGGNEYVEKFRSLSDEQIKFYMDAPHEEVKSAAAEVAKERGLSIVSKEDYIKQFEDFDLSDKKDGSDEGKKEYGKRKNDALKFYDKEMEEVEAYLDEQDENGYGGWRSLTFYTGDGYMYIRDYLTSGKINEKERSELLLKKDINNLSRLIKNNKITKDLALYRMVNTDSDFFTKLREGDVYSDASFSSSSLLKQEEFGDFTIKILAKKGSNVANANNDGELEYLIDKGSKFRVIEKKDFGITVELL